ncbi:MULTISPECIES: FAD binding domain-containing protein [unclassified Bradyrhizobium]|uniref:FAD binding domain-containing protein n=1 Tax=unclassified Bradyrhizobium TaxID=2631580 RepID=UPI0028E18866|nr:MULTISPECIES: FAD binding domain-containing protein [unclassified Bradyrhizobium]
MSVAVITANPTPEFRAGGTDFSERRRSGVSQGVPIDISGTGDKTITWDAEGAVQIGALTTIATIATDARLAAAYPGIAASAQGLATPQVRHVATLGGNLAQRSRCWYFRRADISCLKKSGSTCPARTGNHLYGVAFDLGDCVAPHPSTMAAALLAYDAKITTDRRSRLTIADLLGDGSVANADHTLTAGEKLKSIALPAPLEGERASYKRAISRTHAEWPLVELCARVVIAGGRFQLVRLAAGGVAPVPLRLAAVEAQLTGKVADAASIAEAAKSASSGAKPLPMTAYKVDLLQGLVRDVLERLSV